MAVWYTRSMKYTHYFLVSLVCALCVGFASAAHATEWPASSSGTSIGDAIMTFDASFEPSGIIWQEATDHYIAVGDEGQVAVLSADGTIIDEWNFGSSYDLEDVTLIPGIDAYAYLLDENSSSVRELDLDSGTLTGKSWSCATAGDTTIAESGGAGLEGLAWVPDAFHAYGDTASGGVFMVGWQYDGVVYAFAPNLSVSDSVTYEGSVTGTHTDIAGLFFSTETQLLYVLYDGADVLEERSGDGTLVNTYSTVPGNDQEGVVIVPTSDSAGDVTFAEDSGRIMRYAGYPLTVIVEEDPEEPVDDNPPPEDPGAEEDVPDEEDPVDDSDDTPAPLTVEHVAARKHGNIRVRYSDNSRVTYKIFAKGETRVRVLSDRRVLVHGNGRVAIVNSRTGHSIAKHLKFEKHRKLVRWVFNRTGITLE